MIDNIVFKTDLLRGAKGDKGEKGDTESVPTSGVIAYEGATVPDGYEEAADPIQIKKTVSVQNTVITDGADAPLVINSVSGVNIQVVTPSSPSPYSPQQFNNPSIVISVNGVNKVNLSGITLRAIGDVSDELVINDDGSGTLTRRIGNATAYKDYDTDSEWKDNVNPAHYTTTYISDADMFIDNSPICCDYFRSGATWGVDEINTIGLRKESGVTSYLYIGKSTFNSLAALNTWFSQLSHEEFEYYGILEEPITYDYTAEDMASLRTLTTNTGSTTIESNNVLSMTYTATGIKLIKKTGETLYPPVAGKVIDTLDTSANTHTNAPSINAVKKALSQIWRSIYPIGSVYIAVNNIDPSVVFGGTWVKIKDRFLLASGDVYNNGVTGGEAAHVLTQGETSNHFHLENGGTSELHISSTDLVYLNDTNLARDGYISETPTTLSAIASSAMDRRSNTTPPWSPNADEPLFGEAHNNMPPYLVVNVWQRTA